MGDINPWNRSRAGKSLARTFWIGSSAVEKLMSLYSLGADKSAVLRRIAGAIEREIDLILSERPKG